MAWCFLRARFKIDRYVVLSGFKIVEIVFTNHGEIEIEEHTWDRV